MSKTILQITYKFHSSRAEYIEWAGTDADAIAAVPGLVWKVWLMNEADREAGGIYLFERSEAAQAFVSSLQVAEYATHIVVSSFSVKSFEAVESLSKITRGPLTVTETVN